MIGLVVPALDPPHGFSELIAKLIDQVSGPIVVVNDGSRSSDAFADLEVLSNVTVLNHADNLGKGEALKTAFRHLLDDPTVTAVATVDADGQHLVEDVVRVCDIASQRPDSLILGIRTFDTDVPLRSVFGNRLTSFLLNSLYGQRFKDSQTGLRVLPRSLAGRCLEISTSRYGFELEMLLLAKDMEIVEVTITTVYLDDNRSSHFRPVRDSLGVYLVFLRFSMISLTSFGIDIVMFTILHYFSGAIFFSTYAARFSSGLVNFLTNRRYVFRAESRAPIWRHLTGYVLLAVGIATASAFLVKTLSTSFNGAPALFKIAIDPCLFFISFAVQRYVIFRTRDPK